MPLPLTVLGVAGARGRSPLSGAQIMWLKQRHRGIVEAIAQRNADAAEQAFCRYLDEVAAANAVPTASGVTESEFLAVSP